MKRLIRIPRQAWHSVRSALNRRGDLSSVVSQANPQASLAERVRWMETLMDWVGSTSQLPHDFDETTGQLHWVRIRFLIQFLGRNPEWKSNVSLTIRSILDQVSGVELFSRTGLIQDRALASEVIDRALKKVLPAPPQERNLDDLFPRLFRSFNDAVWVENMPPEVFQGLILLIDIPRRRKETPGLRQSMLDALVVLGAEVAARGISPEMRMRLPFPSIRHSPFLQLRKRLDDVVQRLIEGGESPPKECQEDIDSCFGAIERIYQQLDKEGVSVGLVYNLEAQKAALRRIVTLLDLLDLEDTMTDHKAITVFWGDLIRDSLSARRIRPLLSNNLRLLSQKIVERAGASGEHYITRTREEYRAMVRAGLGGGFVTVFTTLFKFIITGLKLPLFFEGLFASLNYAASFSLMQVMHFSLATKQPAMTGPALAGKLRELKGPKDIRAFVEEVALLTRSQMGAAFGNVGAAIPGAIALDLLFYWMRGSHLLGTTKALYTLEALNPFKTLTLLFAVWTGVILWSSGITAGWIENWVVYRKLPEAIAQHRFLMLAFGERRTRKMGEWFLNNVGGLASCLSLGLLLGFTPVVGEFFGFPLEVRHVTLSSAALGFGIASLFGPEFPYLTLLAAFTGLGCVLVINLSVSLSLAFTIACRARAVRSRSIWLLLATTLSEFRRRPMFFLLPTRRSRRAAPEA